jgi:two-component system phosphate regulon sensor histidine kinase PhoR
MRALVERLRRRIAIKLALTLVGFVSLILLVAGFALNRALEALAVEALEARLAAAGALLHDDARALLVGRAPGADLDALARRAAQSSESRVTIIAADGRVLADSEVPSRELSHVENHAGRPEVRAALGGRVGRDLRRSATIDVPLLYVALPVRAGDRVVGVLRLALPLAVVTASHRAIHHALWFGGAVALALALGIALVVAARVTRPIVEMQAVAAAMSEGEFGARAPVRSPDEVGQLARALNAMAARLRSKVEDVESEQAKIAAILDAMVEAVVAVDGHDHVLLVNEPARRMFGLPTTRLEGKPLLEVVRDVELLELLRRGRAAGGDQVARRELRLAGPSDRLVQANAVALPLGGEERGAVAVLHDVSELRRLEQVRTEFVANVSHELRTPLTAIRGYLETLLGGALDDRRHAREFLEIAFRHTERLGRLLDDLTDLSNIELGRIRLRLEPTPIREVVDSVLTIIRPRAEAGGVALAAAMEGEPPPVAADRDRLAQILINLVDNAVKYTPAGGRVTVRAALRDGAVAVAVEDTGIGIPAADLPRITERFYRVDRARSRELGGTGLGLAIVKHLVIAHGGRLAIESVEGRGTTVRFTLPVAEMR